MACVLTGIAKLSSVFPLYTTPKRLLPFTHLNQTLFICPIHICKRVFRCNIISMHLQMYRSNMISATATMVTGSASGFVQPEIYPCWYGCNNSVIGLSAQRYYTSTFIQVHGIINASLNNITKRFKTDATVDEDENDNEEDHTNETEEEFPWYDGDSVAPDNYRQLILYVKSTRVDNIVSKAFTVPRHKLDDIFYGGRLICDGEKVIKKGKKMNVGDYVDLCIDKKDEMLNVKRVRLLQVSKNKTKKDNIRITARVWRGIFEIEKTDKYS